MSYNCALYNLIRRVPFASPLQHVPATHDLLRNTYEDSPPVEDPRGLKSSKSSSLMFGSTLGLLEDRTGPGFVTVFEELEDQESRLLFKSPRNKSHLNISLDATIPEERLTEIAVGL